MPKEKLTQTINTSCMTAANWGHLYYLALDKFYPIILSQNTRLDHLMILSNREQSL
jgi:hypothetical protein